MNAKARTLLGNILPALGGLFVTYLYNVVDGIFVGRGVGAPGLGQVLTVLILLTHFLRKKGELRIRRFQISGALIRKVCKRGVPEAVTQLTTPVTALCYNLMLARLVGVIGRFRPFCCFDRVRPM